MSQFSRGLLIGGQDVPAAAGEQTEVWDPATGRLLGRTALASGEDVDRAAKSARAASAGWGRTPPAERAAIMHRGATLVDARLEEIALVLTLEQGKPLPDSRKEIAFAAEVLRYYAEEGKRVAGSIRPSTRQDIRSLVEWLPVGVVGAIVPWNYPVDLYAWKVAPALAAGNAIIVKPPVETPFAVGMFAQCLLDAGLPPGVLSDLPGDAEAGQRLSSSPEIDMITATASTQTGQAIMRSAADTMKRVSLELGGHCPLIVLEDADPEEAAAAAARRSFSNTGQICIAVNRVIVAEPIAGDFVAALSAVTEKIKLGHGVEDGVTCGPTTTAGVVETAEAHIADAVERGAAVVTGGSRPRGGAFDRGTFFEPTVLDRVPLDARVMREETFGPVAAVHRFDSAEDAIRIANSTPYGLAAYVFGQDLDRAWGVAESLHAGGVGVNVNDVTELQAPFGGWKMSGFGRELGPEGLRAMMQQRHIRLRRSHPGAP